MGFLEQPKGLSRRRNEVVYEVSWESGFRPNGKLTFGSSTVIYFACKKTIGKSSWAVDSKFATKRGRKEHYAELDRNLAQWTRK
jgi:hypothetical protein